MSTEQEPTNMAETTDDTTTTDETVTVVVVASPFQVSHAGAIYRPGEQATVPAPVAEHWLRSGWVQPAPEPKTAPRRK